MSEGEQIAGLTKDFDGNICVLNLCTVKGNASALKAVRRTKLELPNTKMLVTGCVTKELTDELQKIDANISTATTNDLERIPQILERIKNGEVVHSFEKAHSAKLGIPKMRKNPIVGIVSIAEGCLDACSFCSTRMVKGRLKSYEPAQIVSEVRFLAGDGCKEIWLTAQDAGCYGFDIGTDLAELVMKILREVAGDYRIRMGMGNPRHTLKYADKLVEVYKDSRVFRFLHLPVQSGSNAVLRDMKREHSVEDYQKLVQIFYGEFSDFAISTDIIVGFPNESESDFQKSLDIIKESKPTGCNRTRFVPRKGTVAATLPNQISSTEKYRRSAELTRVFMEVALENNKTYIGKKVSILIDEKGKKKSWIGRADNYKPVAVQGDYKIGDRLCVKIETAEPFALIGVVSC
ncbi:threonylcarbamoyladenosine tRNA methylthiotransferase [Fibrobacterales bacterium]|nr:threonylcarbamoyladenosine tRNA methylthiotransferase [Fibrobacterales bacterium]